MGTYSENLDLRHTLVGRDIMWMILEPFTYTANDGSSYTAPVGFLTDLASIPQLFWSVLPPFWRYAKAAVIHDYMLESGLDPTLCNHVLKEGMQSIGVNKVEIFLIYHTVKLHFWIKRHLQKS